MERPFYFGGTALLIIVVVVMDFMAQVQAHMMSHQYEAAEEGEPQGLRPRGRAALSGGARNRVRE